MRFHKAIEISAPDGHCILDGRWSSLSRSPVIKLFDKWFDVRRMTDDEVESFSHDFMREIASKIRAGIVRPH